MWLGSFLFNAVHLSLTNGRTDKFSLKSKDDCVILLDRWSYQARTIRTLREGTGSHLKEDQRCNSTGRRQISDIYSFIFYLFRKREERKNESVKKNKGKTICMINRRPKSCQHARRQWRGTDFPFGLMLLPQSQAECGLNVGVIGSMPEFCACHTKFSNKDQWPSESDLSELFE